MEETSIVAKKVFILTTGQPSTNPRMIKEYLALKAEGYSLKVFYSYWADWALSADIHLFRNNNIDRGDFTMVAGSPFKNRYLYFFSKILFKANEFLAIFLGFNQNISRATFFLKKAALKEKADMYIAHNLGALPAAVAAAKKFKSKSGFDAEDYHRGECQTKEGKAFRLIKAVEDKYMPACNYITAASPLIGHAYKLNYPLQDITVINNVFSKEYLQPRAVKLNKKSLSLFWFSQTIGPNRGLETVVKAIEHLKDKCAIELYLLGNLSPDYATKLLGYVSSDVVHFLDPVPPDEVFKVAARYDIGLSVEVPHCENRDICLTNKLFTYLLAGNCIIFSDTKAQKDFLETYPGVGILYNSNDEQELAEVLKMLYNDENRLTSAQQTSLKLAEEILNWENESTKLKVLMKTLLSN